MNSNNHNIDFAFKLNQEVKLTNIQTLSRIDSQPINTFSLDLDLCALCGVRFECFLLEFNLIHSCMVNV